MRAHEYVHTNTYAGDCRSVPHRFYIHTCIYKRLVTISYFFSTLGCTLVEFLGWNVKSISATWVSPDRGYGFLGWNVVKSVSATWVSPERGYVYPWIDRDADASFET